MDNDTIQVFRLIHSPANEVFDWLEKNKPHPEASPYDSENRESLEEALIARDEQIINLGLALFGHESDTGDKLYQKGDAVIKEAVLSGTTVKKPWVENSGELKQLIENFNEKLLSAFIANEYIDHNLLTNLFEREKPFNKLDDKNWYSLLMASIANPIISATTNNKDYIDGYDWYLDNKIYSSAWKLFDVLPVENYTAQLLAHFGDKLPIDISHDLNVFKTIERWHQKDDSLGSFQHCRFCLANLIGTFNKKFESFKESDDLALRLSFYGRYIPKNTEDVREFFNRDKHKFLDLALYNENLFRKENIREELGECCSAEQEFDLIYFNHFNERINYYSSRNPEWFRDSDGEIPLDIIKDPIDKINIQLTELNKKLRSLSEDKNGKSIIDEIKDLQNKVNKLLQISETRSSIWKWVIVGLCVGYIINRIF